jgi:flagella basal body P-ring formation protein FlgA
MIRHLISTIRVVMIAVLAVHLVPPVAAAFAATTLPLNVTRTLETDMIRLSDVFSDIPSTKDQVIGRAPAPGQDVTLNARTLMKLASAYGVKWTPTTTADQVVLTRTGTVIDAATIQSAILNALVENGVPGKFDVTFAVPLNAMILPAKTAPDLAIARVMIDPRTQNFTLRAAPLAMPAYGLDIQGKIEPLVDAPVLRSTLAKGALIGATDLDTTEIRASQAGNDTVLDKTQLIGMSARRNILPGRLVKMADIESPLAVKRGEKITLVYRTGVLELSAQGRALQDGRAGDQIKVVNVASKTNLQGTVMAENKVIID